MHMIDHVTGIITAVGDKVLTIDMGSLGLCVAVANSAIFEVGKIQKLHLYLHWNQEQGPTLYGFSHDHERAVFLLVTSCSGIGPKIGLSVLASIGPAQCVQAIQQENPKMLAQVPGIGLKKAEQI